MKKLTKLFALIMCMAFVIMAITPNTAYAATSVGQVKIKSIKADKYHVPVVTWNKVAGATGYVVYRKDWEWGSWKKVGTTKGTSFKDNSAFENIVQTTYDSGDTYENKYRVRAYVKNGKKNTYGKYSKIKSYKFTRYMYNNKLTALRDFETDAYTIIKCDIPKDFNSVDTRWYGNDLLMDTVVEISSDMTTAFKKTEEGQALDAEYDKLVAEADDYYNKMLDSADEEEYAKYSAKYSEAYLAYSEVWDKLHADACDFTGIVSNVADTYYNNLKDSKGNTISTADDIDRIVNEKSTSDYTGWLIKIYGSTDFEDDDECADQTPNGLKVYYDTTDVTYYIYVNVPVESTAKGMYKEKGAKMSKDSYKVMINFMRFENGHRVRSEDMDLNEVDKIIKGIKFTPVTLVKMFHD